MGRFGLIRAFGTAVMLFLATAAVAGNEVSRQQGVPGGTAEVAGTTLSIGELYRYQSLIGTTPEGYSWSSDSDTVLFLWNDQGYSFRDIWTYSVRTGEKTRLTFLGQDSVPHAERPGISQAVMLGNSRVAFTLGGKLHIREPDGSVSPIETEKQAVRGLAVSPDGKWLAFVSGSPVDTRNRVTLGGELWIRSTEDRRENSARRLVGSDDPKIYVQDYEWADDSGSIVFHHSDDRAMPERDIYFYADGELQNNRVIRAFPGDETTRARIGLVSLASNEFRYFDRPDPKHHIWDYGLSGDGKRLFISGSDLEAKEHTIYLYDVGSGARETFYQLRDPRHLRPDWQVDWAPADDGLIILTDRDGWLHLYHQRNAGEPPHQITQGEWEIESFAVDGTTKSLYFTANKSHLADRQIYRVPAAGGEVERVSGSASGTHQPVYSPDFSRIADWYSSDTMPPELFVIDTDRPREATRVTRSPQPEFYDQTWADTRYVEFSSHVDGMKLVARLSVPANFDPTRRYPVIVGSVYSDAVRNQWGGRRSHPTWGLDQYLVGQGYLIISVNVRGSWGQGREHNQTQLHSYGGTDINDLESGVRYLIAQGHADPDRVGIWGSSYGGLMTIMSLAKKLGVYAAGIAGAPATNVWHAYPSQMWIMGPPEGDDMPARYEAQSPLYHAAGIEDPLMIIHGSRDPVVLYSDTIALAEGMIEREQMFELVTLPGAHHGWDLENLPQTRFSFRKMIDFFDRNVKNRK